MDARQTAGAKAYALRLLRVRARTEKEVRDKLLARKYEGSLVDGIVDFLKKASLLDDGLFAKLWVESRIKKPYGLRRLRRELELKGIKESVINEALACVKESGQEQAALQELLTRKLKTIKEADPIKIKARLYSLLLRRGFPSDSIQQALAERLPQKDDWF